jgi:hypothetical protein
LYFGQITLGSSSDITTKTGNHLTVFLLRGLNTKWKQIIAVDITGANTRGNDVCRRLHQIFNLCERSKLNVKGLSSDMGPNNISLWQSLNIQVKKESKQPFFTTITSKFMFADPQHLLKNLKSVVLRKQLIIPTFISNNQNLPSQHVSGQYVKDLWQYDKKNTSGLKFLPH